mgnify:CR=1 FL=1
MTRIPTQIDQIADAYLNWMVAESPSYATYIGVPGGEDKLDDESPAAHLKQYEKAGEVLKELQSAVVADDTDRVTKHAMEQTLEIGRASCRERVSSPV